jgi:hypothetical protein
LTEARRSITRPCKYYARFQAAAAKYMTVELFWVIIQRVVIINYRRFGIIYRFHLQRSRIFPLEDGTDRLSRNISKELPPHPRNSPEDCSFHVISNLYLQCLRKWRTLKAETSLTTFSFHWLFDKKILII